MKLLTTLKEFDRLTAAGILARAALSLEDESNPAGTFKLRNERDIRGSVLFEARSILGFAERDNSPFVLEKIGDMLDDECENLIGEVDSAATLNKLAIRGDLPSDLYEVVVIDNIAHFHGKKFAVEEALIKQTVSSPDSEQHYGPPANENDPFLISLFAKHYQDKFPLRNFTMLVAGQRNGKMLVIHQAWRVYADMVNLVGATTLVEMLERFSDAFGAEIEIGGKKGNFILAADLPKGMNETKIVLRSNDLKGKEKRAAAHLTVTFFTQESPFGSDKKAALAIGIDLDRYARVLKTRGW